MKNLIGLIFILLGFLTGNIHVKAQVENKDLKHINPSEVPDEVIKSPI